MHSCNCVLMMLLGEELPTSLPGEKLLGGVMVCCWMLCYERNYHIYLNHTSLLKAVLLHSGIPEDKLSHASSILCDAMVSTTHTALMYKLNTHHACAHCVVYISCLLHLCSTTVTLKWYPVSVHRVKS